jgi:cellulose synthase/poly-beta-1,6-N-acetylglucosamine synthase-like glycosyltransferase
MAIDIFWLSFGLMVYVYVGYPTLLWLVSIFASSREPSPTKEITLTLLITAHNEEANLEAKLLNSLQLDYPKEKLQILVVSDGSTDATDSIVERHRNYGVDFVRIPVQSGKTHAQNVAVLSATGEVIIFSDATTEYQKDALSLIAGNFAEPSIGAVSGRYLYLSAGAASSMASGAKAYAGYDNTVRHLQSKVGSITGCCGCIYAVRRELYTVLAADLISDLVQPLHVLKRGSRVVFEPRAVASEYSTSSATKEFHMRVRVVARALRGILSVRELLLPWKFPWISLQLLSHKLLRWCVPLFLLSMFVASAFLSAQIFYRSALILQILFYALAAITYKFPLHRRWRPLSVPLYFCTVNAAAAFAVLQVIRGQQYIIWRPERMDQNEV